MRDSDIDVNEVEELIQKIKKLRNGEEVACWHCKKRGNAPIGNYKTTKCFRCNNCGTRLNMD